MNQRNATRELTFAAVLAALYAALTLVLPVAQFSGVQIRFAEALTVLPFLFPAATPGLVVGCAVANLFSPFFLDVIFGTLATLLACLWTQRVKRPWMAPIPPVICNAAIVGGEIAFAQAGFGPAFWPAYALNAFTVGVGELIACVLLGTLVLRTLPGIPFFREQIPADRLEAM